MAPANVTEVGDTFDDRPPSPAELDEARRYGRWQLALTLADRVLDAAYLAIFALWLSTPLDERLAGLVSNDWVRLLALYALLVGANEFLDWPMSFASGYVLEHRFGMSRQRFSRWFVRNAARSALMGAFGAVVVVGLYALIWTTGVWWPLVAAAGMLLVAIVMGQIFPVVILPLFFRVERLEESELTSRIDRLFAQDGLSVGGVYRLVLSRETVKANAMLTGLGRTRRVLLGDTLLEQFTPDEVEVVLAHELGHHVHHHIPKMIAANVVYGAVGCWLCDRVLARWIGTAAYDPTQLPVDAMPLMLLVFTLYAMGVGPLHNLVSRRYERQCDRFALARTGLREAYRSAFHKLARLNKSHPAPHPVAVALFHSHPPLAERLAMADESPGAPDR